MAHWHSIIGHYAGDSDRSDVNLTNLQYFYYYAVTPTTSISAGSNIYANWEHGGSDRFTVPIGLGANTTVKLGKVPVRIGVEVFNSVIQPDNVPATEWDFRVFIIPAITRRPLQMDAEAIVRELMTVAKEI